MFVNKRLAMKFIFSSTKLNEEAAAVAATGDNAESQFDGGLKKTLRYHKNLFFGNLSPSGASAAVADPFGGESGEEQRWTDEYETEEEEEDFSAEGSLNRKIRRTSKFYRINNLSLPLSGKSPDLDLWPEMMGAANGLDCGFF